MNTKRKDFTPTKELESGKRLDNGRNTMKRITFDNKGTFVCSVTSSLDTGHYYNVCSLFFIRTSKIGL